MLSENLSPQVYTQSYIISLQWKVVQIENILVLPELWRLKWEGVFYGKMIEVFCYLQCRYKNVCLHCSCAHAHTRTHARTHRALSKLVWMTPVQYQSQHPGYCGITVLKEVIIRGD